MSLPYQIELLIKELIDNKIELITKTELIQRCSFGTNNFCGPTTFLQTIYGTIRILKEFEFINVSKENKKLYQLNYKQIKKSYPEWFNDTKRKT